MTLDDDELSLPSEITHEDTLCGRCSGTGYLEELADECYACDGTGVKNEFW